VVFKVNHLVSFADSRMHRTLERLRLQATTFKFFDKLHIFNENDLSINFRAHLQGVLVVGSRGFGYWTWKPEVILMAFDAMESDDCLLYVDAGCHLNVLGKARMLEYFEAVRKSPTGIVAFRADPPNQENSRLVHDGRPLLNQPNYRWIKGDVFEYFAATDNIRSTHSQAIGAGVILLKKCDSARSIVGEWRELAMNHSYLFDDSPSRSANLNGFVEHRHDQAVWTLLCLKHNVQTLSSYEYWYPKRYSTRPEADWDALREFPILAKRDKQLGITDSVAESFHKLFRFILETR